MFTGVASDLSGLISYTEPNRLRTLFRHELTHIVTFSALSGKKILRPLEYNFRPAVLLSAWTFIEGSAVQRESDSGYGRMHDPLHYHMLRRNLLDDKFPNFAQMSGAQTACDTGHFRYTFGSYHLLSASLANQYQVGSPYGWGIFQIGLSLLWQGRLVGNNFQHPYTWNHLKVQQLVGIVTLRWRKNQSEGKFGFYRLWEVVFQHKIDYLHVQLQSFEASVKFSPPILPITFSFYSSYDTGFLTIQGFSLLGSTLMPQYREYSRYYVACRYAFYGSADLQLYSWEIQNGPGLGEIFFERWTFYSGYRAAWWKKYFLQSVYFKTQLDMSILYGNVPFGLFLEMHYGIFDKQLGFNYGIQSKLLF